MKYFYFISVLIMSDFFVGSERYKKDENYKIRTNAQSFQS